MATNPFDNIFDQLMAEHQEVQALIRKAEHAPASERKGLLEQIEHSLVPHTRAEEKTLYAVLLRASEGDHSDAENVTNDAYEEHHAVDQLMGELKAMDETDEGWLPLLMKIRENIDHHVEDEEGPLFYQARTLLSDADLEQIHDHYKMAKEGFMESLPAQSDIDARVAFAPNY